MVRFLCFLLALLIGGSGAAEPVREPFFALRPVSETRSEPVGTAFVRAVWLSQFDLQPMFRDGNDQREEKDFRDLCERLCETLSRDGFTTVFLQMRPNGDSIGESDLFPRSKYVAGTVGGSVSYDAAGVLIETLRAHSFSVHGWINPYRLMCESEIGNVPERYAVRRWYDERSGKVKELDGMLYFDPSYPEVRELIAAGCAELLDTYSLDGIHMDDYFYPTSDEEFDEKEFRKSGFSDLGTFRRESVSALVSLLYETAHAHGAVYGIAPAGNLDSLTDGYYADIYRWLSEKSFVDYILPQLYFGFENRYCPFDVMVKRWANAVKLPEISLYIGLTAAKAAEKAVDVFAGCEAGKNEWITHTDVLSRSMACVFAEPRVSGYCFFSYSHIYDRFTGKVTDGFFEEYQTLCAWLRSDHLTGSSQTR